MVASVTLVPAAASDRLRSSAYSQTPPMVSAVISTRRGATRLTSRRFQPDARLGAECRRFVSQPVHQALYAVPYADGRPPACRLGESPRIRHIKSLVSKPPLLEMRFNVLS